MAKHIVTLENLPQMSWSLWEERRVARKSGLRGHMQWNSQLRLTTGLPQMCTSQLCCPEPRWQRCKTWTWTGQQALWTSCGQPSGRTWWFGSDFPREHNTHQFLGQLIEWQQRWGSHTTQTLVPPHWHKHWVDSWWWKDSNPGLDVVGSALGEQRWTICCTGVSGPLLFWVMSGTRQLTDVHCKDRQTLEEKFISRWKNS